MLDGGDLPVVAASVAVIAALLLLRRSRQSKAIDDGKRYPPSLPILPVLGAILRGGMSVLPGQFMRSMETHGPVFSFRMGKRPVVVLNGYEAIFDALVRHAEAFADRMLIWTEANVLNREHRGIIHKRYDNVFKKYHKLSLSILKEFGFGVQNVTETRVLEEFESMNSEILKHNGRSFDPKWPITYATSSVVIGIVFGKDFRRALPEDYSSIVENSVHCVGNMDMTINMVPIARFLPMFAKRNDKMRTAGKRLMASIEVGINYLKTTNSESTFVGRFMEIEGTGYNHQDLLYIIRDFCFGSTETVPTTLRWAMVELANHSVIQSRFQKEIDEMVPGDRLPSLDDKPRLPYTEAVILEVMRKRTVAPILAPHATLRDTKVLEFDVPQGCMIIPNIYSVHFDQQFWKDPENFRPERFLDGDNKIVHSERMIGFGLGKRSCLGEIIGRQSTFLFLTSLVQRFDIRPPEGQKTIEVTEISAATTVPSPFEVRLIPRVKTAQS